MKQRNIILIAVLFIIGGCICSRFIIGGYICSSSTLAVSVKRNLKQLVDPVMIAQLCVQIGDERDDAILALSDAWFHTECKYASSTEIEDLFFYGHKTLDGVRVVVIQSNLDDARQVVTFVGSIESYILHLYNHCTPHPIQAFGEDQ